MKWLLNVFGIADHILVVGHDSDCKDHDDVLQIVIQLCRWVNQKLTKGKIHFRYTAVPVFAKWCTCMEWDQTHKKPKVFPEMPPKDERGPPNISWNNVLSKFSPGIVDVCESLRKLTSARTEWIWNATYQKIFDKARSIIKEHACMEFLMKLSHNT